MDYSRIDDLFKNIDTSTITSKFLEMGEESDDIQNIFDEFFEDEDDKPTIKNAYIQDDEHSQVLCKKCNIELSNINGDVICKECGVLYNNIKLIDESAEWRYYGADDSKGNDPTRCGMPVDPLLPKSSLSTVIRGKTNSYMGKLHAWNSIPYKERSLRLIFLVIQDVCTKINLPNSVTMDAKSLYKVLHEKFNTRGKNRNALVGACILFSSKNNGFSITTKSIADCLKMTQSNITEGCKTFVKMMYHTDFQYNIETSNIDDYIIQCCKQLEMSNQMIGFCKKFARKVEKMEILQEHTPPSIAIGCIYLICQTLDLPITKKKIHEVCNISEVTITKTFKRIEPYQNKILFGL
jgi:transcription initiation factor TFIIIB Brf1 subunit/transcription initiation factor TFIIB